jgi:hypothetical protein
MVERGSGGGASQSVGALRREPGGRAPLLGTLKDRQKGGSRNGVSLKRLNAEGLEGGLLYWGPWVMKGRLWGQASLFMGAQLDNQSGLV